MHENTDLKDIFIRKVAISKPLTVSSVVRLRPLSLGQNDCKRSPYKDGCSAPPPDGGRAPDNQR